MSKDLNEELEKSILTCSKNAKRTYRWAQILFVTAILASFLASVFSAGEFLEKILPLSHKFVIAILAALPATAILINNSLRFEEKTKWYWKKVRIAEKLSRQLRDSSSPDVERISASFSEKMAELEAEWPAMDSPVKQPKK